MSNAREPVDEPAPNDAGVDRDAEPTQAAPADGAQPEPAASARVSSGPFAPGTLIADKYLVERVIGEGGIAVVVAARHRQLEQTVAIKYLLPRALTNATLVRRFLREARLAARIRSEHAVRVYDVATLSDGAPYIVMEYLEGRDLRDVVNDGPLPCQVAVDYVLQACEALAQAHAAGIIHRDLKPENLFLVRKARGGSRVKVLDFGISKLTAMRVDPDKKSEVTEDKDWFGTPSYMSPEQLRSTADVDARADIWAIGVVLYELVTAKTPFNGEGMAELCTAILTLPFPAMAPLREDLPEGLEDVIRRCLEKDRALRFRNIGELAQALKPFAPPSSHAGIDEIVGVIRDAGSSVRPPASSSADGALAGSTMAPETPSAWTPPSENPWRRRGGLIALAAMLIPAAVLAYRALAASAHPPEKDPAPVTVVTLDPKAARFLAEGERALQEGNLTVAKEKLDKASAISEKDPGVLLDVARLAVLQAEVPWLRQRLLPPTAEAEVKDTSAQLAELVPELRKAADDAALASPGDAAAVRIRVDALRIAGEVGPARALAATLGAPSAPETAYALAALDLAEGGAPDASVIERLRTAAEAEGAPGRARAALAYARARAGDHAGAEAEVERMAGAARPYPLLNQLRAYVAAQGGEAAPASDAGPAKLPPAASSAAASAPSAGARGEAEPNDRRGLIEQAAQAENRGQLPLAGKLYEDALRGNPGDYEALAGLGSVSLRQGDPLSARQYFARALRTNPNFMPALVGQADATWAQGDRPAAVTAYKDIIDRFPESSSYPGYVRTRALGAVSGEAPAGSDLPARPR